VSTIAGAEDLIAVDVSASGDVWSLDDARGFWMGAGPEARRISLPVAEWWQDVAADGEEAWVVGLAAAPASADGYDDAMGNLVTHDRSGGVLRLSNGATSALLDLLALAGSALATTDWERSLVVWLAEHDQGVLGIGIVGFDLDAIGWTRTGFDGEHAFLLRVVDAALTGVGWGTLDWVPGDLNREHLRGFRQLVEGVTSPAGDTPWTFVAPLPEGWPRCPTHGVLRHGLDDGGCVVCND
jgi:hypothetical protein